MSGIGKHRRKSASRWKIRPDALEVPADEAAAYREAFPAMLRLLKAVSDAGITIIPGTDALPGYSLHHELELYVRAGIPAPEVWRTTTKTPTIVHPPFSILAYPCMATQRRTFATPATSPP